MDGWRSRTAVVLSLGVMMTSSALVAAPAAGDEVGPSLVIESTSGPITGFPLRVSGGPPDAPVFVLVPATGVASMCRVMDGQIEHVGTGRTCVLLVSQDVDGPTHRLYSEPTTITFTGRYPTALDTVAPIDPRWSMEYPLRVGAGWVVTLDHAAVLDLPPITGQVDVVIDGVPQPPLALSPWSGTGSGIVNIAYRDLTGLPQGRYSITYSYAGDGFHEPSVLTRSVDLVPNLYQAVDKRPKPRKPRPGHAARPNR